MENFVTSPQLYSVYYTKFREITEKFRESFLNFSLPQLSVWVEIRILTEILGCIRIRQKMNADPQHLYYRRVHYRQVHLPKYWPSPAAQYERNRKALLKLKIQKAKTKLCNKPSYVCT